MRLQALCVSPVIVLSLLPYAMPQDTQHADSAASVLESIRRAIGLRDVRALRSLELLGALTRSAGGRTTTAPFQVRILFPDRFQRNEDFVFSSGREAVLKTTLEGDSAWLDGPRRIAGIGDPSQAALRYARNEFLRIVLATLPVAPVGDLLRFSRAPQISPGGGDIALDASGPDGALGRLMVDRKSRLPRELTFDTRSPVGDIDHHVWRIGDYKTASGLMLPHRVVKSSAGRTDEELTIERYVLNPQLTLTDFTRR